MKYQKQKDNAEHTLHLKNDLLIIIHKYIEVKSILFSNIFLSFPIKHYDTIIDFLLAVASEPYYFKLLAMTFCWRVGSSIFCTAYGSFFSFFFLFFLFSGIYGGFFYTFYCPKYCRSIFCR